MPLFKDRTGSAFFAGLIIIAGFVVISLTSYLVSTSSAKKAILTSTLPLTSDNIFSEIQRDLLLPVLVSSLMAQDTFMRDWIMAGEGDVPQVVKYLGEIKAKYNAVTSFLVSENSRIYYHSEGILKAVSPDEPRDAWFFRVRAMKPDYEVNVDPDMANKDTMTIFINYKVMDYDGRFLGATGVGITVGAVKALVEHYQNRFARTVYFTDRQGRVVLHGSRYHGAEHLSQRPGLAPHLAALLAKNEYSAEFREDSGTVLLNARYIPELKWVLVVEESPEDLLHGFRATLQANLAICALVTLLVVLLNRKTVHYFHDKLAAMALHDELTGCANRRSFAIFLAQLTAQIRRQPEGLSALLVDMDHFKDVNDRHGHLVGDRVLQQMAAFLKTHIREWDVLCRWGGEEFLILLKGADLAQAREIAEHLRQGVEAARFGPEPPSIPVTVSIGVAQWEGGDNEASLVGRADRALYRAKEGGRNRVDALAD
ncbi:MAG: sensor domain-containing diguanylate cyclase [Pseudomonadota bacterium]